MSVSEVAQKFTNALKAGDYPAAEALWSDDVVSIEDKDGPMKEVRGREAVHGKGVWWLENFEMHRIDTKGPFLNDDKFALIFSVDFTRKADGVRVQAEEVGLYTVAGGRIVEERFYG